MKRADKDAQARAAAAASETDMRFRWNLWAWARQAADRSTRSAFFHQFSRTPPYRAGERHHGQGATHRLDLPYVFDQLDLLGVAWTAKDRQLASIMSACWINFATSGDPNGAGLPLWSGFRSSRGQVLTLGDTITVQAIPDLERLQRIERVHAALRPRH